MTDTIIDETLEAPDTTTMEDAITKAGTPTYKVNDIVLTCDRDGSGNVLGAIVWTIKHKFIVRSADGTYKWTYTIFMDRGGRTDSEEAEITRLPDEQLKEYFDIEKEWPIEITLR